MIKKLNIKNKYDKNFEILKNKQDEIIDYINNIENFSCINSKQRERFKKATFKAKEKYLKNPKKCHLCKRDISFEKWYNHRNVKWCDNELCQKVKYKKIIIGFGAIKKW